jgi:hypothetical protein
VIGTDGGRCWPSRPTEQALWAYDRVKEKAMVYSSPAVADGYVVFGARTGRSTRWTCRPASRKWTFATRGDVDSSPAIAGGRVYVGSRDKKLYVLDLKTGKKLDEFQAGAGSRPPRPSAGRRRDRRHQRGGVLPGAEVSRAWRGTWGIDPRRGTKVHEGWNAGLGRVSRATRVE